MRYIHFPTTAILSVLHLMQDGSMSEIVLVGREGLVGLSELSGGYAGSSRFEVRIGGMAYRVPRWVMRGEVERSPVTFRLMLNYS
ncbi:hypothetical protein A33K_18621 [Burkholderia humptydooensis MSMB43]|uniref:Uncharacterized protein n=1 Tax=Burkholderia humptydooensis MSMB43 TaxID=441157 RepID=A0ABN0FXR1_9BURK|nr:hypothetical protein A33K_18621 [Burkholderia humptydooensis MSMB43]